jgi:hypothetical protein
MQPGAELMTMGLSSIRGGGAMPAVRRYFKNWRAPVEKLK